MSMEHKKECPGKDKYLTGKRVLPKPTSKDSTLASIIDNMDAVQWRKTESRLSITAR